MDVPTTYPFPPEPWIAQSWHPHLVYAATVIVGCVLIYWITHPKRKPKRSHLIWVSLVLLVASYFFSSDYGSFSSVLYAPAPYYFTLVAVGVWRIFHVFDQFSVDIAKFPFPILVASGIGFLAFHTGVTSHPQIGIVYSAKFARLPQCRNNLKQIGLGLHNYHDVYEQFPVAVSGEPQVSWRVKLLPYIDHAPHFNAYDKEATWDSEKNASVSKSDIYAYQCPSVPEEFIKNAQGFPYTSYAALIGEDTSWPADRGRTLKEFSDGTSNTLLVVEACGRQIPWAKPEDVLANDVVYGVNLPGPVKHRSSGLLSTYHFQRAQALLADGSVRHFTTETDLELIRALSTFNGGETVDEEF